MRHLHLLFLILLFLPAVSSAQDFTDCESTYATFIEAFPDKKEVQIESFCLGVKEANETASLSLKWPKNSFECPPCEQFKYEKEGIHLIFVGQTSVSTTLDHCEGYNYVMNKRIRKDLGTVKYQQLYHSKLDERYIGINQIFNQKFIDDIRANITIQETMSGKLKFKFVEGFDLHPSLVYKMTISDRNSRKSYLLKDLYTGIVFPLTSEDLRQKSKSLRLHLKEFNHPFFCKTQDMADFYLMKVDLTEWLDTWTY